MWCARASPGPLKCTGLPSISMRPPSGMSAPDSTFDTVDLPAPLSPTSPSTSPGATSRFTPRNDCTAPKLLVMFSMRTRAGFASLLTAALPMRISFKNRDLAALLEDRPVLVDILFRHYRDRHRDFLFTLLFVEQFDGRADCGAPLPFRILLRDGGDQAA